MKQRGTIRSWDDFLRRYMPERWKRVRRSRLTPEQRIAEDAAEIARAALGVRAKVVHNLAQLVDPHYDNEHAMVDDILREAGAVFVEPSLRAALDSAERDMKNDGGWMCGARWQKVRDALLDSVLAQLGDRK